MQDCDQPLYRLAYVSSILLPFGHAGVSGIQDIFAVARVRNKDLGVTGILYNDGAYFMQVLEGPYAAVEAVFSSIMVDRRHTDVVVVARDTLRQREFSDRDMALVSDLDVLDALGGNATLPDARQFQVGAFTALMRSVLDRQAGGDTHRYDRARGPLRGDDAGCTSQHR
jgi:hypothetical protein